MDVERPVLPCIWLPVYVESNRSRILLNGTTFGPKQPVFRIRARMRMAKFGSGCSPLRRGKTKSSAASPRIFGMGRDGAATLRVSPAPQSAIEDPAENPPSFRAIETNG